VGNLVCPAIYDLGQAANVVVLSVAEGEDKPLKYPVMFKVADLVLLSKCDLLPHLDVEVARIEDALRRVMPRPALIRLSARTGDGVDRWVDWLAERKAALPRAGGLGARSHDHGHGDAHGRVRARPRTRPRAVKRGGRRYRRATRRSGDRAGAPGSARLACLVPILGRANRAARFTLAHRSSMATALALPRIGVLAFPGTGTWCPCAGAGAMAPQGVRGIVTGRHRMVTFRVPKGATLRISTAPESEPHALAAAGTAGRRAEAGGAEEPRRAGPDEGPGIRCPPRGLHRVALDDAGAAAPQLAQRRPEEAAGHALAAPPRPHEEARERPDPLGVAAGEARGAVEPGELYPALIGAPAHGLAAGEGSTPGPPTAPAPAAAARPRPSSGQRSSRCATTCTSSRRRPRSSRRAAPAPATAAG
jgi:hypothetical protein